jgi:hypothetical protein
VTRSTRSLQRELVAPDRSFPWVARPAIFSGSAH